MNDKAKADAHAIARKAANKAALEVKTKSPSSQAEVLTQEDLEERRAKSYSRMRAENSKFANSATVEVLTDIKGLLTEIKQLISSDRED